MKKMIGLLLIGAVSSIPSFSQNDDVEFNTARLNTLYFKTSGKYLYYNTGGDYADFGTIPNSFLNGNLILHAGNFNSYAPTLTGMGASGNWNISATQWAGQNFIGANSSVGYFLTNQAGTSNYGYSSIPEVKFALGIPSGGETLQSVMDRGGSSSNTIKITGFNNIPGGTGLEMYYNESGNIQAYDRTNSVIKPLNLIGNSVNLLGGNVGIGTANPTQKLSVDGTILGKKVKVSQSPSDWPDYVFDSAYQLAPLHQVEKYIQQNKHLPDVPSAAEIKKDGLDLGDNQAVLLKKIEELTLYIIQQNKEMQEMKQEIKALQVKK